MRISDWSSDVCSSDLFLQGLEQHADVLPVVFAAVVLAERQTLQHQAANVRAVIGQPQQCRQLFGLRKIELQRIGQMLALDGDDSLVVLAATLGLDQQAEPTTRQQGGEITLRIGIDRKSTRLNSSHSCASRMPS